MPKVSIVLTSYNHEKYLQEAIESALNQTFIDFELIIRDDASSDNSWHVIEQYTDPRIKAFRNEKQERAIWGINKSISEVVADEYIAIHHSDDVWEPEKLEKQVAFLDSHPEIGAVFTHVQPIDEEGAPFAQEGHFYHKIFDQPNRTRYEWLRFFFINGNALCHPSVLIRNRCYKECGSYRYGLAQVGDFDMWIRLCLKFDIHILQEKLTRFRVHSGEANASGSRPEVRVRDYYERYQLLANYCKISEFAEFCEIFPEARKYYRQNETNLQFVLAMTALELKPFHFTELFGLNMLFDLIQDPGTATQLKKNYQFDYKSYIALTGKHDPLLIQHVDTLNESVIQRERQISSLTLTLQTIYDSNGWRFSPPARWYGRQRQRAKRLMRALQSLLSRPGGVLPLARIAAGVWRHNGAAGLKSRAAQYLEKTSSAQETLPVSQAAVLAEPETERVNPRPEILFISHEASRTGAPIFLLNLIRYLKRRLDIDCVILLCSGGELEAEFRSLGTTLVSNNRNELDPLVLQTLKKRNIRLVYSNTISNGLIQKHLKDLGCPILCHVHELAFSIERFFGEENLKRVLETTTLFLSGSKAVARYLKDQQRLPEDKVALAYPFIHVEQNQKAVANCRRGALDLPEGAVVIGACGMIGWRNGADLFVQLVRLVLERTSRPAVFVWVGGPLTHGEYRILQYDATVMGVSGHLIFTGSVASHLSYFAQFDIFVLPSREDPFPWVVLDAASLGIPVVCFEGASGAPELVEDDAGRVVSYMNLDQMAAAVVELAENDVLRQRLGDCARAKVLARHDIEIGGNHIADLVRLYL